MAYGFKSRTKSASRSYRRRGSSYGSFAKKFGNFKRGNRRPRLIKFATVGFSADTEKKYFDKAFTSHTTFGANSGFPGGPTPDWGFTFKSNTWIGYDFYQPAGATLTPTPNSMVRGLANGTTAGTRIGNKVTCKYLKGCATLSAARILGPSTGATNGDMNGEALATAGNATQVWQYLRTTFRVVIVKDMQVNSMDNQVIWDDVFENNETGGIGQMSGVHSELKVANMGRFVVLSDRLIKLDGKSPQETIKFMIPGSKVGTIRYNGPGGTAFTDKNVYIVWAAYTAGATIGAENGTEGMVNPACNVSTRMCFTDA